MLSKNISIPSVFTDANKTYTLDYDDYDALLWYIQIRMRYCENNIRLCGTWGAYFSKNNDHLKYDKQCKTDIEMFLTTMGAPATAKANLGLASTILALNNKRYNEYRDSVLLNPYANVFFSSSYSGSESFKKEIWNFFLELSHQLISKGIKVFTNVSSDEQIPLPGTTSLNLSVLETVGTGVYFRCVVSVMTGLIEALALSRSTVYVLFPDALQYKRLNLHNLAPKCKSHNQIWAKDNKDKIMSDVIKICSTEKAPINIIKRDEILDHLKINAENGCSFASLVRHHIDPSTTLPTFDEWEMIECIESLMNLSDIDDIRALLNDLLVCYKPSMQISIKLAKLYHYKLSDLEHAKKWYRIAKDEGYEGEIPE